MQRLQKFLSEAGLCSRREGELWIATGRVTVNGEVAELGQKIDASQDDVRVDGKRIRLSQEGQRQQVIVMNKPRGFICSHGDPHHSETVFDLLPKNVQAGRLLIAGRLDKDSEGLLVFTNSGDFAQKLTHPSNGVVKRYRVQLNRNFNTELHLPKLMRGVRARDNGDKLEARRIIPCPSGIGDRETRGQRLEVHLAQGKKREIRRMFEAVGYFVKRLKRIQIGTYTLKGLGPGEFKILSETEAKRLLKASEPPVNKQATAAKDAENATKPFERPAKKVVKRAVKKVPRKQRTSTTPPAARGPAKGSAKRKQSRSAGASTAAPATKRAAAGSRNANERGSARRRG